MQKKSPDVMEASIALANELKICLSTTRLVLHFSIVAFTYAFKVLDTTFLIVDTHLLFILLLFANIF